MPRDSRLQADVGFTLIELMIVVVIIGILAAIAIPKFTLAGWHAKEREADMILKQIYTAQEAHEVRTGSHATTLEELETTGYYRLPELQYYDAPAATAYALPLCLRATGDWSDRQIDADGVISDC